jgi:hypothetical protein
LHNFVPPLFSISVCSPFVLRSLLFHFCSQPRTEREQKVYNPPVGGQLFYSPIRSFLGMF